MTEGECRVDYFDSKRQVIDFIEHSDDYKSDLKEISALRLKMWEEEAVGAKYRVRFDIVGTMDLNPVEVRFILCLK